MHVSAVGLGGWALGGATDWGATEETDARRTIFAALDAGITLFDTAPIYGESEVFLGRALKGRRPQVVLATKCGLVKNGSWTDHDLRPQTIISQLEQSLSRLQTDYIDLYQIHYPDPRVPLEEALAVLIRLREQGKIRYIGLCNAGGQEISAAAGQAVCVQNEFSLLHPQKGRAVFAACEKLRLGFIGYGTLCGGIYGDVEINPDSGSLSAESAAMNDCNVRAHIFDAKFADCTIKSGLICEVDEGDITIENTFATVVACKTKKGNIGAAGLSCKNTAFDTAEGNITATICGDESTFDVWVNAREGTCNRQSANIEGNSASFKAHSAKGNIFADFVPSKEE